MVVEEGDQEARAWLVDMITWHDIRVLTIPDTDWWEESCQPMISSDASDQGNHTLPKATTMLRT